MALMAVSPEASHRISETFRTNPIAFHKLVDVKRDRNKGLQNV